MSQTSTYTKIKLLDCNKTDLEKIYSLSDPRYATTLPSIMVSWYNSDNNCQILLGENFSLVRYSELNGETFWSPIGSIKSEDEFIALWNMLRENNIKSLRQCTDIFTSSLTRFAQDATVSISASNRNTYDYLFNTEEVKECKGHKYEELRRSLRNFEGIYSNVRSITSRNIESDTMSKFMHLYEDWMLFGTNGSKSSQTEKIAIRALLEPKNRRLIRDTLTTEIFLNDRLAGIAISEILDNGYALAHFQKANLNVSGITKFLFYTTALELSSMNIKYLNFQDDLGIEGLRGYKKRLGPSSLSQSFDIIID